MTGETKIPDTMAGAKPLSAAILNTESVKMDADLDDLVQLPPHLLKQVLANLRSQTRNLRSEIQQHKEHFELYKDYIEDIRFSFKPVDFQRMERSALWANGLSGGRYKGVIDGVGENHSQLDLSSHDFDRLQSNWKFEVSDMSSWGSLSDPQLEIQDADFIVGPGKIQVVESPYMGPQDPFVTIITGLRLSLRLRRMFNHDRQAEYEAPPHLVTLRHLDGRSAFQLKVETADLEEFVINFQGTQASANDLAELLTFVAGPSWYTRYGM